MNLSLPAVCDCGISWSYLLTVFYASAVDSVKQKLSGKECDKALSWFCYHALHLPHLLG